MSRNSALGLSRRTIAAAVAGLVFLAGLGGLAAAQQDRYTVRVPDGLPFSDFKGYEDWRPVAVSQTESSLKVIAANTTMLDAYRAGVPGNHQKFPEGSKIVKIEWLAKKSAESPYFVKVPDTLKSVSFIEKDRARFADTGGWAYAQFLYEPASGTFKANGSGAKCGYACHTRVAAKDFIFTAYPPR